MSEDINKTSEEIIEELDEEENPWPEEEEKENPWPEDDKNEL